MSLRTLVVLAGAGAGLMYLLDPDMGNRRRARMRDRWTRLSRTTGDALDVTSRDVRNRARGVVAELRARLAPAHNVGDDVLHERVRARIGQVIGHARSVQASVEDGRVTLTGPVLESEVGRLVRRVGQVRGVQDVVNRLEVHAEPGEVPGLQAAARAPHGGEVFELMQRNWSPAARAVTTIGGALLTLAGLGRRDAAGLLAATVGVALLARGATNTPLADLLRIESTG
jgi:hypothetical protein